MDVPVTSVLAQRQVCPPHCATSMSDVKKSWRGSEGCTVVFPSNLVMSLYAPTSDYDVAVYEMVVGQVRSVLREARDLGAERFFLAGDFNLEFGMLKE